MRGVDGSGRPEEHAFENGPGMPQRPQIFVDELTGAAGRVAAQHPYEPGEFDALSRHLIGL